MIQSKENFSEDHFYESHWFIAFLSLCHCTVHLRLTINSKFIISSLVWKWSMRPVHCKVSLEFVDKSFLSNKPYSLGMSTIMILLNWWHLWLYDSRMRTFWSLPMAWKSDLSSCMIYALVVSYCELILLLTHNGITFVDALKLNKQLWKL